MANNELHQILNQDIHAINRELTAINSGGCGLAALTLHSALLIRGIASEIVLVDHRYDRDSIADLFISTNTNDINSAYRQLIQDDHDGEDACNGHICVLVDGYLYDSDGLYGGEAITEHIEVEVMETFLTLEGHWNGCFKRSNNEVDDIRGTFERFFDSLLADIVPEMNV